MKIRRKKVCAVLASGAATAIGVLGLAPSAFAHEGEYAKFNNCPSTTAGVARCLYSVTESGSVVLGEKTVPILNAVTVQGGYSAPNSEQFSTFYGATDGDTLSKTPQNVPGGLLGIVPPDDSPWLVKQLSKFFFENGLTGVHATVELARPASEIQISERRLLFEVGTALKLPVRIHLENPFLGRSCYVGSSGSPIIWNLTTGTTEPPPPNEPISGYGGEFAFQDEGQIVELLGVELVDNAWAAPHAAGCGGILAFLVNPVVDAIVGLPAPAGSNTAILQGTTSVATAKAVNEH